MSEPTIAKFSPSLLLCIYVPELRGSKLLRKARNTSQMRLRQDTDGNKPPRNGVLPGRVQNRSSSLLLATSTVMYSVSLYVSAGDGFGRWESSRLRLLPRCRHLRLVGPHFCVTDEIHLWECILLAVAYHIRHYSPPFFRVLRSLRFT